MAFQYQAPVGSFTQGLQQGQGMGLAAQQQAMAQEQNKRNAEIQAQQMQMQQREMQMKEEQNAQARKQIDDKQKLVTALQSEKDPVKQAELLLNFATTAEEKTAAYALASRALGDMPEAEVKSKYPAFYYSFKADIAKRELDQKLTMAKIAAENRSNLGGAGGKGETSVLYNTLKTLGLPPDKITEAILANAGVRAEGSADKDQLNAALTVLKSPEYYDEKTIQSATSVVKRVFMGNGETAPQSTAGLRPATKSEAKQILDSVGGDIEKAKQAAIQKGIDVNLPFAEESQGIIEQPTNDVSALESEYQRLKSQWSMEQKAAKKLMLERKMNELDRKIRASKKAVSKPTHYEESFGKTGLGVRG